MTEYKAMHGVNVQCLSYITHKCKHSRVMTGKNINCIKHGVFIPALTYMCIYTHCLYYIHYIDVCMQCLCTDRMSKRGRQLWFSSALGHLSGVSLTLLGSFWETLSLPSHLKLQSQLSPPSSPRTLFMCISCLLMLTVYLWSFSPTAGNFFVLFTPIC